MEVLITGIYLWNNHKEKNVSFPVSEFPSKADSSWRKMRTKLWHHCKLFSTKISGEKVNATTGSISLFLKHPVLLIKVHSSRATRHTKWKWERLERQRDMDFNVVQYMLCVEWSETKKYALRSLFLATHYSKCIIAEMTFCQSSASEFQNKCPDSNIENLGESEAGWGESINPEYNIYLNVQMWYNLVQICYS